MPLSPGLHGRATLLVTAADTALALKSGAVDVLGTPRVVALAEEAAVASLAEQLAPGQTTVSMRVQIDHLAPINVGSSVTAEATLANVEGRRLTFTVAVSDHCGLVAAGKVTRVVVETVHFLEQAR
ncbi:MAG: thioesterase [Acidimicrobiia bacterium]|nr:thioesterase [Acidimicrobiia bacterium]